MLEIKVFSRPALTTTVSDIEWDWDDDNLWEIIDNCDDIADLCEKFKLPPTVDCNKLMNEDETYAFDVCYDSIRHNRVTFGAVAGLPETIEVPAKWDDEEIAEYISNEYGFCIKGFARSEDHRAECYQ